MKQPNTIKFIALLALGLSSFALSAQVAEEPIGQILKNEIQDELNSKGLNWEQLEMRYTQIEAISDAVYSEELTVEQERLKGLMASKETLKAEVNDARNQCGAMWNKKEQQRRARGLVVGLATANVGFVERGPVLSAMINGGFSTCRFVAFDFVKGVFVGVDSVGKTLTISEGMSNHAQLVLAMEKTPWGKSIDAATEDEIGKALDRIFYNPNDNVLNARFEEKQYRLSVVDQEIEETRLAIQALQTAQSQLAGKIWNNRVKDSSLIYWRRNYLQETLAQIAQIDSANEAEQKKYKKEEAAYNTELKKYNSKMSSFGSLQVSKSRASSLASFASRYIHGSSSVFDRYTYFTKLTESEEHGSCLTAFGFDWDEGYGLLGSYVVILYKGKPVYAQEWSSYNRITGYDLSLAIAAYEATTVVSCPAPPEEPITAWIEYPDLVSTPDFILKANKADVVQKPISRVTDVQNLLYASNEEYERQQSLLSESAYNPIARHRLLGIEPSTTVFQSSNINKAFTEMARLSALARIDSLLGYGDQGQLKTTIKFLGLGKSNELSFETHISSSSMNIVDTTSMISTDNRVFVRKDFTVTPFEQTLTHKWTTTNIHVYSDHSGLYSDCQDAKAMALVRLGIASSEMPYGEFDWSIKQTIVGGDTSIEVLLLNHEPTVRGRGKAFVPGFSTHTSSFKSKGGAIRSINALTWIGAAACAVLAEQFYQNHLSATALSDINANYNQYDQFRTLGLGLGGLGALLTTSDQLVGAKKRKRNTQSKNQAGLYLSL